MGRRRTECDRECYVPRREGVHLRKEEEGAHGKGGSGGGGKGENGGGIEKKTRERGKVARCADAHARESGTRYLFYEYRSTEHYADERRRYEIRC